MRTAEYPFVADWFAISLRWLTLLGLAVSLALTGQLTVAIGGLLFLMALWNIYASGLAVLNRRMRWHRLLNVTLDVLATLAFFWLSHDIRGPIAWIGLLALFSAAIYFDVAGSLLICLVITIAQTALVQLHAPLSSVSNALGSMIAFNSISGVGLALISRRLITGIRNNYLVQVKQRRDAELRIKKQEFERLRAFYNLTATLSATLSYQTVLDSSLDLGAKMMDDAQGTAESMVSAALLFEDDQLKVRASRRLGPADERVVLPGQTGLVEFALHSGEPCVSHDPGRDPELGRFIALRACQSVACLALRSGIDVFGILLFAHPNPDYFNAERCEVLEIISRQEVIGIQNARLYQQLEEEKDHLVEIQEETRKKLARDLHDGPIQSVAGIAMRVNFTQKVIEKDRKQGLLELEKIEELARRTVKELRHLLFTLRPLVLESEGLVSALNVMADQTRETYQQNVFIEADPKIVEQFEINRQTAVFYLVEEAVNNARKHAKADHIWVRLKMMTQMKDLAMLEIQDDGIGFNVDEVNGSYERRGSLGMVNLRERTELVSGVLNVQSTIGRGTRVQVFIPLSEEAADKLRQSA